MQTADALSHPDIDANLGYFLVGSTSPDIRVITRQSRGLCYFTDLDFRHVGTGVERMFNTHPELLELDGLDGPTRAFVAGYITHLLVDETYIFNLFRPYFGSEDVFENATIGRMMDRVLQLDLDRDVWRRVGGRLENIEFVPERVQVSFIELEYLSKWRDWVIEVGTREFTWERLRNMSRRIAAGEDQDSTNELVDNFILRLPESLVQIYDVVPHEKVEEFKTQAFDSLVNAVGEYLD